MESGLLRDAAVVERMSKDFVAAKLFIFGRPDKNLEAENLKLYKKMFTGNALAVPRFAIVTSDGRKLKSFGYLSDAEVFLSHLNGALEKK